MTRTDVIEALDRALGLAEEDADRWALSPYRDGWLAVRNDAVNDGTMYLILDGEVEMFQHFRSGPEETYDRVVTRRRR